MRRGIIAFLAVWEFAVASAIVGISVQMGRDLQRSPAVGGVTHAVASSTLQLACELRASLHHLIG